MAQVIRATEGERARLDVILPEFAEQSFTFGITENDVTAAILLDSDDARELALAILRRTGKR